EKARQRLAGLEKRKDADRKEVTIARDELQHLHEREVALVHGQSQASVDSELMLLWWETYDLVRWVPNPLNFQASAEYRKRNPPVVMTCRIDGPTAEIARRRGNDVVASTAKCAS